MNEIGIITTDVELKVEDEIDEAPYVEYDIAVSPSDNTLEVIVAKMGNEDIIIPFYQRRYVWSIEQASKLIESFLMGLPVPQIFLYVNNENQLEVIDGQQRLMSLKFFFDGYFGDENKDTGERKVFRLRGLSSRSEYNDKTFKELSLKDQRKLKNSTLRAINIKQITPSNTDDCVYHIFERLNTGGTSLKPQEIRNAVFRGKIVTELALLNQDPNWRIILGQSKVDKNQKDIELVLRLFSLYQNWGNYEKPMVSYLNKSMENNKLFTSDKALQFKDIFPKVTKFIVDHIDRPFRPKGVINIATLEAVMITFLENYDAVYYHGDKNYITLMADDDFKKYSSGPTADTQLLRKRLTRAKEILL